MFTKTGMLEEKLLEEIRSASLAPGAKIPSQNRLVKKYGVSRTTVERAIASLIHSGQLVGQRGRGTFVASSGDRRAVEQIAVIGARGPWYPFSSIFNEEQQGLPPLVWHDSFPLSWPEEIPARTAVIWLLPSPDKLMMMEMLKKRGVPQLVIHREYGEFDCIVTNHEHSLAFGMARLAEKVPTAPALVTLQYSIWEPYREKRAIAFYENCAKMGWIPETFLLPTRHVNDLPNCFKEVISPLFDRPEPIHSVVALNFEFVMPLLMEASHRQLVAGKDFFVLTFDHGMEWTTLPGVFSMCHPYPRYHQEICRWVEHVNSGSRAPFHVRLNSDLLTGTPSAPGGAERQ